MLILKSITLKNFRAIREGTLEPLEGGITGLSGPNGTGKSAFLDGLLWAMYGVLPTQATQKELRNLNAETKDDCFVDVVLETAGGQLRVRRKLTGKNATATLDTWRNGDVLTETSVKVGQIEIVKMTELTQEAFITTVLVQQKHLDDLVSSAPTPRREMIERLSGIDNLSTALKLSREESNYAKTKADAAIGSEEEIALAQADKDAHRVELDEVSATVNEQRQRLANLQSDLTLKNEQKSVLEAEVTAFNREQTTLDAKKSHEQVIRTRLAGLEELVQSTSKNLPAGDVDDILAAHAIAQDTLAILETERDNVNRNLNQTRDKGSQVRSQIDSLKSRVVQLNTEIDKLTAEEDRYRKVLEHPVSGDQVITMNQNIESMMKERGTLQSREIAEQDKVLSLTKSIDLLEGEEKQACPTCQSQIDDPVYLLESLRTSVVTARENIAQLKNDITSSEEKLSALAREKTALEQSLQAYSNAQDQAVSVRESITSREALVQETETTITQLSSEREVLMEQYNTLTESVKSVDERGKIAQREVLSLDAVIANIHEVRKAKDQFTATQEELSLAVNAVMEQEALMEGLSQPDQTLMNEALTAVQEAGYAVAGQQESLRPFEDRLISVTSDLSHAEERLRVAKEHFEHKKDLLSDLSNKVASSQVLDEFRKAQIARIAPELSSGATGLVNSMTDGFYVEVTFDENFTPTLVRHDGQVTPLSFLSGGEKSVVALAMRIAISDLISGSQGGLLMLDEVLTAQDNERRQYLVETLRALSARQIVMINHTQGANDIVDKSLVLSRDDEGNTVIAEDDNGTILGS